MPRKAQYFQGRKRQVERRSLRQLSSYPAENVWLYGLVVIFPHFLPHYAPPSRYLPFDCLRSLWNLPTTPAVDRSASSKDADYPLQRVIKNFAKNKDADALQQSPALAASNSWAWSCFSSGSREAFSGAYAQAVVAPSPSETWKPSVLPPPGEAEVCGAVRLALIPVWASPKPRTP